MFSRLIVTRLTLIESAVNVCFPDFISLVRRVVKNKNRDEVHQAYRPKISRNPAFGLMTCRSVLIVRSGKMLAILET